MELAEYMNRQDKEAKPAPPDPVLDRRDALISSLYDKLDSAWRQLETSESQMEKCQEGLRSQCDQLCAKDKEIRYLQNELTDSTNAFRTQLRNCCAEGQEDKMWKKLAQERQVRIEELDKIQRDQCTRIGLLETHLADEKEKRKADVSALQIAQVRMSDAVGARRDVEAQVWDLHRKLKAADEAVRKLEHGKEMALRVIRANHENFATRDNEIQRLDKQVNDLVREIQRLDKQVNDLVREKAEALEGMAALYRRMGAETCTVPGAPETLGSDYGQ